MNKKNIIDFFDRCAPTWDTEMIRSDDKINFILDKGGVGEHKRILDVACGTGVLFPDYLARNVSGIVGVDISPEMAKIAAEKFPDSKVGVLCADIFSICFIDKFDCIMVYNALPHFPNPAELIAHLSDYLLPGGRLTIAHGMSRSQIDAHHNSPSAQSISAGLMHEDELEGIMSAHLNVDVKISDSEKYIVSGTLK